MMKRNMKDLALGAFGTLTGLFLVFSPSIVRGFTLFRTDILFAKADTYLRVLGALMALVSLILIVRAFCTDASASQPAEKPARDYTVRICFAGLILYLLLMEPLGFIANSVWLMTLMTFLIRKKETKFSLRDNKALFKALGVSVLYALVLVLVLTFVFTTWLRVRLP